MSEIANILHDAMLREIARLAPAGTDRALPVNAVCDAMITLLAELLTATQPDLPAAEIERLTVLFHDQLEAAIAERSGPVGHA